MLSSLFRICALVGFLAGAAAAAPLILESSGAEPARVACWLESSSKRVFPGSQPGEPAIHLLAPRKGRVSFQVCFRSDRIQPATLSCSVEGADDLKPLVRLAGLVPMPHLTPHTETAELEGAAEKFLPGLCPDPLFPAISATVGLHESRSFWITLNISENATPGSRQLNVKLTLLASKKSISLPVTLEISPLIVKPRQGFPIIHWWRGEATWDFYKTGMFDERWYDITKAQLDNMLAHGSDVIYVPVFFDRREIFQRPCQLLVVDEPEAGKYTFDWSGVKKFTDLCKSVGFTKFEWSHLWIYWGADNPVRIYRKQNNAFVTLWHPDISGFSDTFLNFLKQFLPDFEKFLRKEGLMDSSYFHLSDEPGGGQHIANYKRARQILRDLAPWMKVMDALSDVEYGKQGLTDIPIPMVNAAQAYIDAKIPHWVYYCCAPQGPWLNRFLDTPLTKIRMSGLLFYKLKAQGFLHWGYNYWHRMETEIIGEPFTDSSNASWPGIPYGDPFVIYPGADGKPIDSIRWEVFAEAMQDYAVLQSAHIMPDDPLLGDIKSYAEFPREEKWHRALLEKILRRPAQP